MQNGQGGELGTVAQDNAIGKIRFGLMVGDHRFGGIYAENWRAWNFSIPDHTDSEVARITKTTWEGRAKTPFTTAANHVARFHRPLEEPRSLVVASALCVDTALKQDSRGFG